VTGTLLRYRIMAYIVGTLLIVLVCIGVPLKYLTDEGTGAHDTGEWITTYVGVAHGWLYMVFLVCAVLLARAARWSIGFTAVTLLSGLVPFVTFYAERRATARTRQFMRSEAMTESR
jgi:integral membrane protein